MKMDGLIHRAEKRWVKVAVCKTVCHTFNELITHCSKLVLMICKSAVISLYFSLCVHVCFSCRVLSWYLKMCFLSSKQKAVLIIRHEKLFNLLQKLKKIAVWVSFFQYQSIFLYKLWITGHVKLLLMSRSCSSVQFIVIYVVFLLTAFFFFCLQIALFCGNGYRKPSKRNLLRTK